MSGVLPSSFVAFILASFKMRVTPRQTGKSRALKKMKIFLKKTYVIEHLEKRPKPKGNGIPTSGWPAMIFEKLRASSLDDFFLGALRLI
jgi:hypothetical protein